ncbi:hypothetical protein NIES4071_48850 [Calothrix sp. NIES-4071]|nr:hypothetical protein NIES4071_48850 [Calothrix sp. NIES-4071]BAZ59197.1 hypothetical protein NIES4105_48790 [Calothrix sp. NIES-4105]
MNPWLNVRVSCDYLYNLPQLIKITTRVEKSRVVDISS